MLFFFDYSLKFTYVIIFCLHLKSGALSSAPPPIAAEKECSVSGSSLGRLEWRAWRDASGAVVARCYLHGVTTEAAQLIVWSTALGKSKKSLRICESIGFEDKYDNFYCEYRVKVSYLETNNITKKTLSTSPNNNVDRYMQINGQVHKTVVADIESLQCWVKTENPWSAEYKTWCSSDVIYVENVAKSDWDLSEPAHLQAMKLAKRLEFEELENFKIPRGYYISSPPPFNEPYGVFLVDVEQNETSKLCPDSRVLVTAGVYPIIKVSPPTITFVCRAIFQFHNHSGNFSLAMYKSNTTWPIQIFTPMKTCYRLQKEFWQPLTCKDSYPIIPPDRGRSKFLCTLSIAPSKEQGKEPGTPDIPPCSAPAIIFSIRFDPYYLPRLERSTIKYNSERQRWGNRTKLPWDTLPHNMTGVKLNARQVVVLSCSSVGFLLLPTVIFSAITTVRKKRTDNLLALPCPCRGAKKT